MLGGEGVERLQETGGRRGGSNGAAASDRLESGQDDEKDLKLDRTEQP